MIPADGYMRSTFCDLGRAIAALDQNIATLGTECSSNSFRECINTLEELCATLDTELELLMGKS